MELEIISILIGVFSLMFSIISMHKSNEVTKQISEKTMNSKFFEEIFFEDIILKLPKALADLENSPCNHQEACNRIDKTIVDILERAKFYKYFDEIFYNNVKNAVQSIQDKEFELLDCMDNENIGKNIFNDKTKEINCEVDKLYNLLKNQYSLID